MPASDGRNAGRETARQPDQDVFDRRRALVLGSEDGRVIGVVLELGVVRLLGAQAEELLDAGTAVGAANPAAGGAPLELGGSRGVGERLASAQQGLDIDAVDNFGHLKRPFVYSWWG